MALIATIFRREGSGGWRAGSTDHLQDMRIREATVLEEDQLIWPRPLLAQGNWPTPTKSLGRDLGANLSYLLFDLLAEEPAPAVLGGGFRSFTFFEPEP
jgi:hypothetical protein